MQIKLVKSIVTIWNGPKLLQSIPSYLGLVEVEFNKTLVNPPNTGMCRVPMSDALHTNQSNVAPVSHVALILMPKLEAQLLNAQSKQSQCSPRTRLDLV